MNQYLTIPFLLYFSLKFVLEASNKIMEQFRLEKSSKIIWDVGMRITMI